MNKKMRATATRRATIVLILISLGIVKVLRKYTK